MTVTTIKVPSELRDALKEQARAHGRTLSQHLGVLVAEEGKRERFQQLREAMANNPPDDAYVDEARDWASDAWS